MVGRIVAWSLVAVVALLVIGAGVKAMVGSSSSETPVGIGRFQVVRQTPDQIILLDTTSGELYRAEPGDIKPYGKLNQSDDDDKESDSDD